MSVEHTTCTCLSLQELNEYSLFCVECADLTCQDCLVINEDSEPECSTCFERRSNARGFAALTTKRRMEVSARGGRISHERGKAHRFTPDEAKAAGRVGGASLVAKRGSAYMSQLAQRGARKRGGE